MDKIPPLFSCRLNKERLEKLLLGRNRLRCLSSDTERLTLENFIEGEEAALVVGDALDGEPLVGDALDGEPLVGDLSRKLFFS